MPHPLSNPTAFARDFFRLANAKAPPHGNAPRATAWFEERMLALAQQHGLYCQNKQTKPVSGEWMKIDHVFVESNDYGCFPIAAVEHDNGDLSDVSKSGALPKGTAQGAYIEWAAWKALTMTAQLHVVVAYPWREDRDACLKVLGQMVSGYERTYGSAPNALFLLGWWSTPSTWASAENLYVPYTPARASADRALSLKELSLT